MNIIFTITLFILIIVWLGELNYRNVHRKVQSRWARGDKACRVQRTWWGWRVVEYAEDVDSPA